VAERIIGMGDVLGIIEKAEQAFAGENVEDIEKRLGKGSFDFHDMLQTFQMMKKMGPMKNILKMLPGVGAQIPEEAFDQVNEKDTGRIEAIILSMTHRERSNPDIINGSRRKRIARGSGTSVEEVNRLIKQFHESRRTMKQVAQMQRKAGKFGRFGKR
jgi:signal recognition particle subunit SRP54